MVSKFPDKVTMEWNTSKRKGKVFFDYNQNSRGKTTVSVYSLRPNAAANVSMPVGWDNLDSVLPNDFTITSVPQLITKKNDIRAGVLGEKQNISKIISKVR